MLWHLALSSVPALLILRVGSGAEQLKDAVELYPPMAGPAALLAHLFRLTLCIPWPDDPQKIHSSCLRRQTGSATAPRGHFNNCISSCALGFLSHSWRSLSPGTACCPADLVGTSPVFLCLPLTLIFTKTICRMGERITSSMDIAELCRGSVGVHE